MLIELMGIAALAAVVLGITALVMRKTSSESGRTLESVNYHFTRQCNYECGFCFHTAKTSHVEDLERAKRGLRMMAEAGMKKVNFSGGEPFIQGKKGSYVGKLVEYCKHDLQLDSVSIVSNGSLITKDWFEKYSKYLDILAISFDSFNEDTLKEIGRKPNNKKEGEGIKGLFKIRNWCEEYGVLFKLNTVVNTYNWHEDMNEFIQELDPYRWKVFQCLLIDGENAGEDALRHAEEYVISEKQFQDFINRHRKNNPVKEDNDTMRNSYIILDEHMRFLNNTGHKKTPSRSILEVGVEKAFQEAGFDQDSYIRRGGHYEWNKTRVIDIEDIGNRRDQGCAPCS